MDIFDILGPIMVGPSSSHTAGAARIGGIAVHGGVGGDLQLTCIPFVHGTAVFACVIIVDLTTGYTSQQE